MKVNMAKAPGQIGFGIIGLGFGESRCAMVQQVPEARLVAVASRTEERARATGVKFEVDWYTDYHRMLERNDLDVVAIYTPSGAHTEIVQAAARAGKHVLTTKPLEISLARADAIVDACRTAGVKLATEFAARYTPANYALYRAVHDGKAEMWTVANGENVPSVLIPPAINVFQDVARWIQDGHYASATLADGEDSRKTLELVLALYESARTGRTIALG